MYTRISLSILMMIFAFGLQAQFGADKQIKKKILQDRYKSYISDKGYEAEIDDDGDVKFQYNNRTYYITIHESDEKFFRIAQLSGLTLSSDEDITTAMKICHEITKTAKVAKLYWRKNVIWTSTELLLSDPDDFEGFFDTALELTEKAYLQFVDAWKKRND